MKYEQFSANNPIEEDRSLIEQEYEPESEVATFEVDFEDQDFSTISERITEALNSETIIAELVAFPPERRYSIIGSILTYYDLHKDGAGLEDFIESLKTPMNSLETRDLLFQSVLKRLNLSDSDSVESKKAIYEYFMHELGENGHYWHSFNGEFEESIKEKGLNPDDRPWDWSEINKLDQICRKSGEFTTFGWSNINAEGNLFYSDQTEVSYNYAVSSPEWFSIFISSGADSSNQRSMSAFQRRDYEGAKENVLKLCDRMMDSTDEGIETKKEHPNITLEEKIMILEFFEKNWLKFAGPLSDPKLALIKRSDIDEGMHESTLEEYCNSAHTDIESINIRAIFDAMLSSDHDARTQKTISFDRLEVVDLPGVERVQPELM